MIYVIDLSLDNINAQSYKQMFHPSCISDSAKLTIME
jgi:hypothetical protein